MLSDLLKHAAGSGEHSAPPPAGARKMPVAVTVKAEPLDVDHAAAQLAKALHANDVNGVADALRLAVCAVLDETKKGGKDSDGDEDAADAEDAEADEQEDEGGE